MISVVLRKCKVLAASLGNEEFECWVDSELGGYNSADELPPYRVLRVDSRGDFVGMFWSSMLERYIPTSCLPEEYREGYSHCYFIRPISEYEALVLTSPGEQLQEVWSPDFVSYMATSIFPSWTCTRAWKDIPYNSMVSLVDAVRNRILSFVLAIGKEAPDAWDVPVESTGLTSEMVSQVFNMTIIGNVQNVATGSTNVIQHAEVSVHPRDFDSLSTHLKNLGVSDEDVDALEEAMQHDREDDPDETQIGERVAAWMARTMNSAAEWSERVGTSVAVSLVANAIMAYYGG